MCEMSIFRRYRSTGDDDHGAARAVSIDVHRAAHAHYITKSQWSFVHVTEKRASPVMRHEVEVGVE